jgi:hypothetical protein
MVFRDGLTDYCPNCDGGVIVRRRCRRCGTPYGTLNLSPRRREKRATEILPTIREALPKHLAKEKRVLFKKAK